ncbi:hypothetical protein [Dysgonomonas macrotermitis]|nr:hypothetical protein [Dysgonomonas macrotermitis]
MKKKNLLLMSVFSLGLLNAQVGINTQNPQGVFHIDAYHNTSSVPTDAQLADDIIIDSNGKIGFGMMPSLTDDSKIQVKGGITIVDGNQSVNKVLISDANGTGTWQTNKISYQNVTLSGSGATLLYNQPAGTFLLTGTTITLPPGRYAVNVYMILRASASGGTVSGISPTGSYFLLRSTFSDSNVTLAASSDIEGATHISGVLQGAVAYGQLAGCVFINNSGTVNKTYYYIAGDPRSAGTTEGVRLFGAGAFPGYNSMIIYKLED